MFGMMRGVGAQVKPTEYSNFDDFDRANSSTTLGNSKTGQAWSAGQGVWGIDSNRAWAVSTPQDTTATAHISASLNKAIVKSVFFFGGEYIDQRLIFRYSDIGNHLLIRSQATRYEIMRRVGGTAAGGGATVIATINVVPLNGDSIEIRLNGSNIDFFINGKLELSIVESLYTSVNRAGFGIYYGSTVAHTMRFDTFRVVKR